MAHELTYERREESHKYSKSFSTLHLHHYQTSKRWVGYGKVYCTPDSMLYTHS
jgi:hypothetical protein